MDGRIPDIKKIQRMLRRIGTHVSIDDIKRGLVKREAFKPTFLEQISGKSVGEIEKEREKRLEAAWKRREKEAKTHDYGE